MSENKFLHTVVSIFWALAILISPSERTTSYSQPPVNGRLVNCACSTIAHLSSLRWLDQGSQFIERPGTYGLMKTRQAEPMALSTENFKLGLGNTQPGAINTRVAIIITLTQLYFLSVYYVPSLCWVFKDSSHYPMRLRLLLAPFYRWETWNQRS